MSFQLHTKTVEQCQVVMTGNHEVNTQLNPAGMLGNNAGLRTAYKPSNFRQHSTYCIKRQLSTTTDSNIVLDCIVSSNLVLPVWVCLL